MKRIRYLAGAAALLLLTACPLPRELRETPPPPVHNEWLVSAGDLNRRLNDPATVILQAGADRAAYDAGHIPGARFVPLSALAAASGLPAADALVSVFQQAGVSNTSRVVVYSDDNGQAAARAFVALDYLGHTPAMLNGGLAAWRAANHPVTSAAPNAAPGTLAAAVRNDLLVNADWIRGHLRDSTVALIDARTPEEFSGATPGDGVQRPGHIPGAHELYWQNTLVSQTNPTLRGVDVLHALYRLAGARFASDIEVLPPRPRYEPGATDTTANPTGRGRGQGRRQQRTRQQPRPPQPRPTANTVVIYGRTGDQASWDYFVARYLGYNVRLYDAGYVDWSARGADYPVER